MSGNNNDNKKDFEGLGPVLDHEYDEIRELDNPLPGWWLLTFYGTVVFSVIYYVYYTFMGGPTSSEELQKSMQVVQAKIDAAKSNYQGRDLKALFNMEDIRQKGKAVYDLRCAVCHAPQGQGLIGPNLNDDNWIHGDGSLASIEETLKKGVIEKGMPAWEAILSPEEMDAVTIYVKSLRGGSGPNPKAPEGELKENIL